MDHVDLWDTLRNSWIPHPARDGTPRGLTRLRNRAFRASLFAAIRPACRRSSPSAAATTVFRHSGTARTRSYGVDVPFMQLQRHGWDIHIVSAEPDRDGDQDHWPQESQKTQQHQRTRPGRPNGAGKPERAPRKAERTRKTERAPRRPNGPGKPSGPGKPERAPGRPNGPGKTPGRSGDSTSVDQKSMSPPPPGMAGAGFFSGFSAITASVVRNRPAIDAAFCSADRVTFAGSMMPALNMST
jgi:hypothetical protein